MKIFMYFCAVLFLALFGSCNKQSESVVAPRDLHAGTVHLSFARTPSGIVQVDARLSRAGYDDKVIQLSVADTGKVASGSFSSVPVGTWHLKVDALNDTGAVQYSGETDLDVLPGQTTQVSLELLSTTGGIDIVVSWGASCTPAPSGLVSWWTGDGDARDRVGTNNGTLLNGASFAPGKVGRAFSLDGVNDYVIIPNSSSLNPAGGFSIDAWIYPKENKWSSIMTKWADSYYVPNQRSYGLEMAPGLNVGFAISDSEHQNDAAFQVFRTTGGVLSLNQWNHVAGVYDQTTGTRRIYVNGVKIAERVDTPIVIFKSITDLAIGAAFRSETVPYETPFPGLIDEVDFYDRALADQEIQSIYHAGSAGKCR